MIIEKIDLREADAEAARRAYDVVVAVENDLVPEGPTPLLEQELDFLATMGSWTRVEQFVAWTADRSEALGFASAEWETLEENSDLGGVACWVRPGARGNGIGRELVRRALAVLKAEGRTKIYADVWEGSPGEAFATGLGLEPKLRERFSRCQVADIDLRMLRAWVDRAKERADGYTLLQWNSPTPEEHLEELARIVNFMNTAPLDDFEMEDQVTTPEMLRERDEALVGAGIRRFTSVVRHDSSGQFAGFTSMNIDRWHPEQAHQGGTCTDTAHRNKGIGRWLKAANALWMLEECPDVAYIDTDNAGSNRTMLAINEAMGFRPRRYRWAYQGPLAVIEERLEGARSATG